ncbi:MAG: LysM peptidoglycan-binding domain-containing protein [Burkholderiales bacterium]|nr:LysM peptidoglycan-binding domain-containing protein [Burkholderiales bacterium]
MPQQLKFLPLITALTLIGCASTNPNSPTEQTYLSSATNNLRANQPRVALEATTQALKLNSNNYQAYYLQAQAYQQLGESLNATTNYQQALKLNSSNVEVITSYANFLCANQDYVSAETQYAKAYQFGKQYNVGWEQTASDHGDCLSQQNKLNLAIESYQIAINGANKPASAYLGLSYVYIMQQDFIHAAYSISQYPGEDTPQSLRLKIAAYDGLAKNPNVNAKNKSILKTKTAAFKSKLAKLEPARSSKKAPAIKPLAAINHSNSNTDAIVINNTQPTSQAHAAVKLASPAQKTQSIQNKTVTAQKAVATTSKTTATKKATAKPKTFANRIQKNTHGRHYIVVEPGDTLFKLAQQSKLTETKLTQLNKLKTKNVPLDTRLYLD